MFSYCLLQWIVGWDDARISGGRGGYGKSGNCSDIAYFTYFFIDGS